MSEVLDEPPKIGARGAEPLVDPFGRTITYLRVSVTDRCNLRCSYCMPERMTFLPRKDILSLEEMERLIRAFVRRGVRKIRLTGGEPLVRRNVDQLIENLGELVNGGALDELTLTTNGTELVRFAPLLVKAGVRRINVSLDSLDKATFERLTRRNSLNEVLAGLDAALAAGLKVKINTVALKTDNAHELARLVEWAHMRGMDLSLIEIMPMGEVEEDRIDQYLPLSQVREDFEKRWTLTEIPYRTGGPSRYVRIEETGGRLGFITPLTNNFCAGCNRVRLTCTGRLYMCLGQNDDYDFLSLMRAGASDADLDDAINAAIARKPKAHDFAIDRRGQAPAVSRRMSVTGG